VGVGGCERSLIWVCELYVCLPDYERSPQPVGNHLSVGGCGYALELVQKCHTEDVKTARAMISRNAHAFLEGTPPSPENQLIMAEIFPNVHTPEECPEADAEIRAGQEQADSVLDSVLSAIADYYAMRARLCAKLMPAKGSAEKEMMEASRWQTQAELLRCATRLRPAAVATGAFGQADDLCFPRDGTCLVRIRSLRNSNFSLSGSIGSSSK